MKAEVKEVLCNDWSDQERHGRIESKAFFSISIQYGTLNTNDISKEKKTTNNYIQQLHPKNPLPEVNGHLTFPLRSYIWFLWATAIPQIHSIPQMEALIRDVLAREQSRDTILGYRRPYPPEIDLEPYPIGYSLPAFQLFDGTTDLKEHLARFESQCGDTIRNWRLWLRQFPSSLTKMVRSTLASHLYPSFPWSKWLIYSAKGLIPSRKKSPWPQM